MSEEGIQVLQATLISLKEIVENYNVVEIPSVTGEVIESDNKKIVSAINDCMKQIDETSEKEMAKITGGMKLPGMF